MISALGQCPRFWYAAVIFLLMQSCSTLETNTPSAVQELLLQDTKLALSQAQASKIPVLSPDNYSAAERRYQSAQGRVRRGGSIENIQSDLAAAQQALDQASQAAELARVALAGALEARTAATAANADELAAPQWQEAEQQFRRAARELENGDLEGADGYAAEAFAGYRQAELAAILGALLHEARALIAAAIAADAEKYAPISLKKATDLVAHAQAALTRDRYNISGPLALALHAEYEAEHARYVAKQVESVRKGRLTTEQLILAWERPLAQIATALDTSADLSSGPKTSRDASLARIAALEAKAVSLQVATNRISELEELLGTTRARVLAADRRKQQIDALEQVFPWDEARILQEGDVIVIRMTGLDFSPGEAVIRSENFGLLSKLEKLPQLIDGAMLIVEGHTDAIGNDIANLTLSKRRANAVRAYLLANTSLPRSKIETIGYGEEHPIANNETADGRALNRRTDIVIVPKLDKSAKISQRSQHEKAHATSPDS